MVSCTVQVFELYMFGWVFICFAFEVPNQGPRSGRADESSSMGLVITDESDGYMY